MLGVNLPAQTFYEPFDYPFHVMGQPLGGNGGWMDGGNAHVASGNLTLAAGMVAPVGNSAQITGGAFASLALPTVFDEGTVYFSYAFRLDFAGTFPSLFKSKDTISFTDADGIRGPTVRVVPTSGTTFQLALAHNGTLMATNPATFNAGDTLFIVGSYTFNPAGTNDDTFNLWVNPSSSTLGTSTPPTPGIVNATSGRPDANNIGGVALFDNSQLGFWTMDELRIGTSWQDVTPVPEPSTATILIGASLLVYLAAKKQLRVGGW